MDKDAYISFMAVLNHPIVESLAKMRNIPDREALDLFYNSNFYRLYEREDTKLWHFSAVTLTDLLNQEITTGRIEYIDTNYAALHTFGDEHIVWNIDEYMKNHITEIQQT